MRFSIIVPVYNVESYLQSTIDSVLSQSFSDFELILCDDGSTDNSGAICNSVACRDTRIKVLHLKNGGPSSARNAGLSCALGEYIFFLDSDDKMCDDVLFKLNDIINQNKAPDAIIGTFLYWDGKSKIRRVSSKIENIVESQYDKNIFEINEKYALYDIQLPWCVYQMIIRRNLLAYHGLVFDTRFNSAEDLDFYMRAIKCINTYVLVDLPFVLYRIGRAGSIVTDLKFKDYYGELSFIVKTYNDVDDFPHPIIMKRYFADEFTDRILKIARFKGSEKIKVETFIKDNWDITNNTTDRFKFRIARLLWQLFGLYNGSKIIYFFWIIKKSLTVRKCI